MFMYCLMQSKFPANHKRLYTCSLFFHQLKLCTRSWPKQRIRAQVWLVTLNGERAMHNEKVGRPAQIRCNYLIHLQFFNFNHNSLLGYNFAPWASYQIRKIAVCACAGNAGNVSDFVMHHGTCVTHVPGCMPGSLTSGFLWSRWQGKRSRHSRRMRNPQFYVSGKRPMDMVILLQYRQRNHAKYHLCGLRWSHKKQFCPWRSMEFHTL